jgi:hypothetical protein
MIKTVLKKFEGKCGRKDKLLAQYLISKARNYNVERTYYSRRAISHWRRGTFMPLWIALEFLNMIKTYSLEEMENNVISYKCRSGKQIIPTNNNKRLLPIAITPEFVSIYFHLTGDGHVDFKKSIASYFQVNELAANNFIQKLKNCFGEFNVSYKKSNVTFPIITVHIIKHWLEVEKFGSKNSIFPEKVSCLGDEFKLASFTALLVDEGSIEDEVSIGMTNYNVMKKLHETIKYLGYFCSELKLYGDVYSFNLYNKSLDKFYIDLKKLKSKYPTCSLSNKSISFEILYEIHKRGTNNTVYDWNAIENNITRILSSSSPLAIGDIRILLKRDYNISSSYIALRRFLTRLHREGKINRIGKSIWAKLEKPIIAFEIEV